MTTHRPPTLTPEWRRKMLEEKTTTLPMNWDEDTLVMSKDTSDKLRFECLPELEISDLTIEE